ncbi:MAG: hypothetical protein ACPG4N_05095 [Gammaproteobacteria bacterium]
MKDFMPCKGKEFCTEGGDVCQGCGRTHVEIAKARNLVEHMAGLADELGYENVEAFLGYMATKAAKKVNYRRAQETTEEIPHEPA